MEIKWKLEWDYLGWETRGYKNIEQKDWNQTLITRINEISAEINIVTNRGNAKEVKMHPVILAIVKSFDYYKNDNDVETISDRYKIIVDESLPIDKLYVIRKDELDELVGEITIINHTKPITDILTGAITQVLITQELIDNNINKYFPPSPNMTQEDLYLLIDKSKKLVQEEKMPKQTNTNLLTDKQFTNVTHGYLKDEQKMVIKIDVKNMTHEDRRTFVEKIKNLIKTGKYE